MYSNIEINEMFDSILNEIRNGNSLRKSLIKIGVANHTFYKWIEESEEKMQQYARACDERCEYIVDEALDIVDDTSIDKIIQNIGDKENPIEIEKTNNEAIQRSKLRFEARQWLVGKLNPKKYGNKVDLTSGGEKIQQSQILIQIDGEELNLK